MLCVSNVAVYTLHKIHCFTATASSHASDLQFIAKTKEAVSATCCYSQRQLTWEVTESGQRNKIELKWDDITSLRVTPMVSICSLHNLIAFYHTCCGSLVQEGVLLSPLDCKPMAESGKHLTPDAGTDQGCCCYRDQQLSYWKLMFNRRQLYIRKIVHLSGSNAMTSLVAKPLASGMQTLHLPCVSAAFSYSLHYCGSTCAHCNVIPYKVLH